MKYLGITQKTASWLLLDHRRLDALAVELLQIYQTDALREGILVIGALRICAFQKNLICIWNSDYLSSTGVEEWGFCLMDEDDGLFSHMDITNEVLERTLYLFDLRLQGFLLPDDRFIHRSLGDNINSCLAGRGKDARKLSLGYMEGVFKVDNYESKGILSIGPIGSERNDIVDLKRVHDKVIERVSIIESLIRNANKLLSFSGTRPAIDSTTFLGLKELFVSDLSKESNLSSVVEQIPQLPQKIIPVDKTYETIDWTYEDWIAPQSLLSELQRRILEKDILLNQPLRITGAAGTGKTLLMQLLCVRRLQVAKSTNQPVRVLYVVHNNEMANSVINRFTTLGVSDFLSESSSQKLEINTLFGYAKDRLDLPLRDVIDKDAYQTKIFQRDVVKDSVKEVAQRRKIDFENSKFLSEVFENIDTVNVYADLIGAEIGVTIKGRDLTNNKQQYIASERPLSRLHGILNQIEREVVYDIFISYYQKVFEELQVLDSDDIALSLLGRLKTPLWEMKRKKEGFDFVFIDETQLFNENERQIFHLLTKGETTHLPIALALDEAQEIHGAISSGFATLGIENISNQMLFSVYRSTSSILKLAFFIVQRTTDLFTSDFPDYTEATTTLVPDDHPLAEVPKLSVHQESQTISKSLLREIRILRGENIRQIAVVVHADKYWNEIHDFFTKNERQLPIIIQVKRGERINPKQPLIVITRPETVGGQEFDAVIAVGIEKGLVPPIVKSHSGLETALEQQSYRELYLSFTRARYRLIILNSKGSVPSAIIEQAIKAGLIVN